jgi:hypothetical protein
MDFQAHFGITVKPTGLAGAAAVTYQRKVKEHLTWIYRTKVGRTLLKSIHYHHQPVEIRPYLATNCNATASAEPLVPGGLRGVVNYSPDTFSLHGACSATHSAANSGLYWDEVLFHELVHVFRRVSGKFNRHDLGGALYRYDTNEEFIAIMVTNIYISDRSNKIKSSLRRDHRGFQRLPADFAAPFGFFSSSTRTFALVEDFVKSNHGFSAMVAHVDAPFNPIADYMADKNKARDLSNRALGRDIAGVALDLSDWAKRVFH